MTKVMKIKIKHLWVKQCRRNGNMQDPIWGSNSKDLINGDEVFVSKYCVVFSSKGFLHDF